MTLIRYRAATVIAFVLACFTISGAASAFSITGNNFTGSAAYQGDGLVVETYGAFISPEFATAYSGYGYNVAAALSFDFNYMPSYPTTDDVRNNPSTDWFWTVTVRNLRFPCCPAPIPDLSWNHIASYDDINTALHWADLTFPEELPDGVAFDFFTEYTSPTTGTGTLVFATTLSPYSLPEEMPHEFFDQCGSGLEVGISAEPLQTPIPEPATMLLFGAGLAGVGLVRRRKN